MPAAGTCRPGDDAESGSRCEPLQARPRERQHVCLGSEAVLQVAVFVGTLEIGNTDHQKSAWPRRPGQLFEDHQWFRHMFENVMEHHQIELRYLRDGRHFTMSLKCHLGRRFESVCRPSRRRQRVEPLTGTTAKIERGATGRWTEYVQFVGNISEESLEPAASDGPLSRLLSTSAPVARGRVDERELTRRGQRIREDEAASLASGYDTDAPQIAAGLVQDERLEVAHGRPRTRGNLVAHQVFDRKSSRATGVK